MELTPDLLLEAKFGPSRRGYDMEEVDDFLERVAAALEELQRRLAHEFERAEAAEAELEAAHRSGATPPTATPAEAPAAPALDPSEPMRILVHAERTAEAVVAEARSEAARLTSEAEETANAQRSEASQLLTQARTEAEAEARRAGEAARRAVQEEVQTMRRDRDGLSEEVRSLKRWLDEQRTRMRTTVRELQRVLDDPDVLRDTPVPTSGPPTGDADEPAPAAFMGLPTTTSDAPAGPAPRPESVGTDDGEPTQAVPVVEGAGRVEDVIDVTAASQVAATADRTR